MSVTGGNGNVRDTGRIEAFSDGVFAIAITLLIIDIGVPHVGASGRLLAALARQWPSYFGYVTSFIVIGTMWANHHNRFRYIVRTDHVLLFLNTLLLMCVAFIPFPTALLAEYINEPEHQTTVVAVYSGTMFVTAIFFTALWIYVAADYRLLDTNLSAGALRAMTRRYEIGLLLYGASFGLSFVSVTLALAVIVGLALVFVFPEPEDRPPREKRRGEEGAR